MRVILSSSSRARLQRLLHGGQEPQVHPNLGDRPGRLLGFGGAQLLERLLLGGAPLLGLAQQPGDLLPVLVEGVFVLLEARRRGRDPRDIARELLPLARHFGDGRLQFVDALGQLGSVLHGFGVLFFQPCETLLDQSRLHRVSHAPSGHSAYPPVRPVRPDRAPTTQGYSS